MNFYDHPKEIEKGKKIADRLIRKAKKEEDTKGYRENLGYDSIGELAKSLKNLNLNYRELAEIIQYFYSECDKI